MTLDIKREFIRQITKPTQRDQQRRIGPSSLGNACSRCLSREMVGEAGDGEPQDFSLYPWIGTAGHAYLETTAFQSDEYLREQRVTVGDVEGYGTIKGTADLILPGDFVGDYKFVGKKKIDAYRTNGPNQQYRYQIQLYGRGAQLAGYPVEKVAIIHIPRDSPDLRGIWVHEEEYNEDMAIKSLDRAGNVYAEALAHGWESLPSYSGCFVCGMRSW